MADTPTGYGSGWRQAFIDMNGDGYMDYVRYYMTPDTSAGTRVRINLNLGGAGFNMANTQIWDSTMAGYSSGWKQVFIDMNGDSLPDYVRYYLEPTANASTGNGTRVRINLNTGSGFGALEIWDNTTSSYGSGWRQTFMDMNNDGLIDYIRYYMTPNSGTGSRVRVNWNKP